MGLKQKLYSPLCKKSSLLPVNGINGGDQWLICPKGQGVVDIYSCENYAHHDDQNLLQWTTDICITLGPSILMHTSV